MIFPTLEWRSRTAGTCESWRYSCWPGWCSVWSSCKLPSWTLGRRSPWLVLLTVSLASEIFKHYFSYLENVNKIKYDRVYWHPVYFTTKTDNCQLLSLVDLKSQWKCNGEKKNQELHDEFPPLSLRVGAKLIILITSSLLQSFISDLVLNYNNVSQSLNCGMEDFSWILCVAMMATCTFNFPYFA